MEFSFAKYTEITDLAFKHNKDYKKDGFIRFFICPDVNDYWFIRILKDYNEEYEKEEGSFIMERNKISNNYKGEELTLKKVVKLIKDDDGGNWDFQQSFELEELIEMLDDGYGILNLKAD